MTRGSHDAVQKANRETVEASKCLNCQNSNRKLYTHPIRGGRFLLSLCGPCWEKRSGNQL